MRYLNIDMIFHFYVFFLFFPSLYHKNKVSLTDFKKLTIDLHVSSIYMYIGVYK